MQREANPPSGASQANIATVVVDVRSRSVDRPFDYLLPDSMEDVVRIGTRVLVPFGGRMVEGCVVGLSRTVPERTLLPVDRPLEPEPTLTGELVDLARWMSHRYLCTLSSALACVMPPGLKSRIQTYVVRTPSGRDASPSDRAALSASARAWLERLATEEPMAIPSDEPPLPPASGLRDLIRAGLAARIYRTQNTLKIKYRPVVERLISRAECARLMDQCPPREVRKRRVLSWLMDLEDVAQPWLSDVLHVCNVPRSLLEQFAREGVLRIEDRAIRRDPYVNHAIASDRPKALTDEQREAVRMILKHVAGAKSATILLHGVTGSGKTEVYLQSIADVIGRGRDALLLVPEIALTPQMVDRFKQRFGDAVAVLHSRLSSGERFDEWRRIREGTTRIVVGARSAVFAPLSNLGLIVVDEEHEHTYKQEESPRYLAREVASYRAAQRGAVLVLGSATPSLESSHRARIGLDAHVQMTRRVKDRPLPPVQVVDMRRELVEGNRKMFSRVLVEGIAKRLAKKEQVILLLNRRGYSTFILCRSCGEAIRCPDCDVSLTHHVVSGVEWLRCHYCGYARRHEGTCPSCRSRFIRQFGAGTQRIEESLMADFPDARILRMDVDTTRAKGAHQRMLDRFGRGDADILLGTQMIAKGLDFPRVTLVGVLAADQSLHLPDFRASERTFQLLTQVAGRAGRDELAGEVVIQTYNPEHAAIAAAATHDYERFYQQELHVRSQFRYPPFCEMASFLGVHEKSERASRIVQQVHHALVESGADLTVMAPAPAPFARLHGRYRYQVIVKYENYEEVREALAAASAAGYQAAAQEEGALQVDVNAQSFL